eukprot:177008_1
MYSFRWLFILIISKYNCTQSQNPYGAKDPRSINISPPQNVIDYGTLAFPLTAADTVDAALNIKTIINNITFDTPNDFIFSGSQLIEPDPNDPQFSKNDAANALDLATASLSFGGAIASEDPFAEAAATINLVTIIAAISGVGDIPGIQKYLPNDPEMARFQATLKIEEHIDEQVNQNNILMTAIANMIQETSNEIKDQISWTTTTQNAIDINSYYSCYRALTGKVPIVNAECGCANANVSQCVSNFAKRVLDPEGGLPELPGYHKQYFVFTTGSGAYEFSGAVGYDKSRLYTFAAAKYDKGYDVTKQQGRNVDLWLKQYLQLCYKSLITLQASARVLVWASSVLYGTTSSTTRDEWVRKSQDILSLSSYCFAYMPRYIKDVFLPQFVYNAVRIQCDGDCVQADQYYNTTHNKMYQWKWIADGFDDYYTIRDDNSYGDWNSITVSDLGSNLLNPRRVILTFEVTANGLFLFCNEIPCGYNADKSLMWEHWNFMMKNGSHEFDNINNNFEILTGAYTSLSQNN